MAKKIIFKVTGMEFTSEEVLDGLDVVAMNQQTPSEIRVGFAARVEELFKESFLGDVTINDIRVTYEVVDVE